MDCTPEDFEFLLDRALASGSVSFAGDRWTGASSNALVAVAYGRDANRLPSDASDLSSCYRCLMRMPEHRRSMPAVLALLKRGEDGFSPEAVREVRAFAGWPSTEAGQ